MNSSKGNKEVDNGSEEKYVDSAEASHKTKLGSSLDPNDHSIRKCQIAHMPKRDEKDASKSSADFILANPISIGDKLWLQRIAIFIWSHLISLEKMLN